jgi:hypothetical protein
MKRLSRWIALSALGLCCHSVCKWMFVNRSCPGDGDYHNLSAAGSGADDRGDTSTLDS